MNHIFSLLYSLIRVYILFISTLLRKIGITNKKFFKKRFSEITSAFIFGCLSILKINIDLLKLKKKLNLKFEPYLRGFAYEGTGMGFGIRSSLHRESGKKFEIYINQLSNSYVYQYYVGLGWWLHTLYGFNGQKYNTWVNQLNPMYSPIIFDGVGFKVGIFNCKANNNLLKNISKLGEGNSRVFFQGFGRSLWFQKEFSILDVLYEVEEVPEKYKKDCISGVGLAIAYSFFDQLSLSFNTIQYVPDKYKDAFAQGMAFGWEARRLQNQEYWDNILNNATTEVANFAHQVIKQVSKANSILISREDENFYLNWVDLCREQIRCIY